MALWIFCWLVAFVLQNNIISLMNVSFYGKLIPSSQYGKVSVLGNLCQIHSFYLFY